MEWTGARYADAPEVVVDTWIAAPPERVWPLVSDLERMPARSRELESLSWLSPDRTVGARFVGHNAHPSLGSWSVEGTVVECDAPDRFAWEMDGSDATDAPSARWTFTLVPDDGGTRLTQRARMGPGRSGLSRAIDAMPDKEQKIVFVRLREFESAMTRTLEAVRAEAEASG
ncbi:SRPBCC family protein [Actinomycetospora termitidis]|uniref:SRPBCC family protein n=1 Tax=Actinomycetospora termitidis TaxID=3053470 RepID=A0ABT7M125_9PSEU|nr:SRPBCC family protein [Actinomycetospora sp. Odt1-22]MDL5154358.1 SRPBCC family protein [Actinomycetospora sp. Odt1-22]